MFAIGKPFTKTIPQGAATSIYVATAPELEGIGGKFYENSNESIAKPYATNPRYAERLWNLTIELIQKAKEEGKEKKDKVAEESKEILQEVSEEKSGDEDIVDKQVEPEDKPVVDEVTPPVTAGGEFEDI